MARTGRICSICSRDDADAINGDILRHEQGFRAVASRYGVTRASLQRHAATHMRDMIAQSKELQARMQTERLVARIEEMERIADDILAQGAQSRDQRLRLLAIREVRGNVEMLLKIGVAAEFEQRMTRVLERIESPDGDGEGGTT